MCLGVCVCEGWGRHYIVGLGAGGWEQLKSEARLFEAAGKHCTVKH